MAKVAFLAIGIIIGFVGTKYVDTKRTTTILDSVKSLVTTSDQQ